MIKLKKYKPNGVEMKICSVGKPTQGSKRATEGSEKMSVAF
jgi:hypothetical protein